jgi:Tol biopolymer transport system component
VWAADGHLAFVRRPLFESEDELIVTRADGSEPSRVASGMDISQPAWSLDGSRIAFVVEGSSWVYTALGVDCVPVDSSQGQTPPRLFVADVASGTAARVANECRSQCGETGLPIPASLAAVPTSLCRPVVV